MASKSASTKSKSQSQEQTQGTLLVSYGAHSDHPFNEGIGMTVSGVRKALKDVLNVPETATANVNGESVKNDHVLRAGDKLHFKKQAGRKG